MTDPRTTAPRATAFVVLGAGWIAFAAFELFVWLMSGVGTIEPVVAIATRIGLGGGAIACARAIRAGTLPMPPALVGLGYAVLTIAIAILGIGLSVPPGSALGFLSLGGYSRAPNVFMPDVRQSMESGFDLGQLVVLGAPLLLFVLALVAAATPRPVRR